MLHGILINKKVGVCRVQSLKQKEIQALAELHPVPATEFEFVVDTISNIDNVKDSVFYIATDDQFDYLYHNYGVI